MNKEEIVKLLMWLGDCYNMDNRESAEKCADEYISENEPKALNIDLVSGISLEQLKLQKECYRERKERNGKATAYGEAHNDEIREGVIDHLIALINYR